jgi:hypothetical protein
MARPTMTMIRMRSSSIAASPKVSPCGSILGTEAARSRLVADKPVPVRN